MSPSVSFEDHDQAEKRVNIGKVANVHGVKGLVKLLMTIEFVPGDSLSCFDDTGHALSITLKSNHGKYVLAAVDGVNSREAAEALKGTSLFLPRADLSDDIILEDDIAGMDAFDENGKKIGTILTLVNFGASDLLEIKPADGGESFYVPMTDEFVVETDTIIIRGYEEFLP